MNVFIRRHQDNYEWFATSDEAVIPEYYQGSLEDLGEYYHALQNIKNWVLIAPALSISARTVEFTEKEKKHIKKALPFILEEDLLTEADDLHYVTAKPKATSVAVIALDKKRLQQWLDELALVNIKPTYCLPECKLLSDTQADWQIFYRNNEFIIRTHNGECAAFEATHFALSVELLTENYSKLPLTIELIADDEAAINTALDIIPEPVKHLVESKILNYADMIQLQFSRQIKLWNLLKGRFAQSHQWLSLIHPWRWVILVLMVVFSVHTALVYVDFFEQKNQSQALKAQMKNVFLQVIPKGQIVDYRKQLGNELRLLQGGSVGDSFIQQMNKTGLVLSKHDVDTLNTLNYSRKSGELKLELLLENYDKLEAIMNDLKAAGLDVEIQDSSAQDDKLRARIKITGQS